MVDDFKQWGINNGVQPVPVITRNEWNRMYKVMNLVGDERARQIARWGGRSGDGVENPSQSNYMRLRVLAEEFGEVAEAMGRTEDGNGTRDLKTELIQVAAVAVAWIEALEDEE